MRRNANPDLNDSQALLEERRKAQSKRMVGALLREPFLAVTDRIFGALEVAGLDVISQAHLAVFQQIDEGDGSRLVELAQAARMTKQSMSYLVENLINRGYLEQVPDPSDGRAHLIRLTAQGYEVMRIARVVVSDIEQEWGAYLGPERMADLMESLRDIVALLEAKAITQRKKPIP